LSYADWSGIRPISLLEFNKASYGPLQPIYSTNICASLPSFKGYPAWGSSSIGGYGITYPLLDVGTFASPGTNRVQAGASYYGVLDLTGNAHEPVVRMNYFSFQTINGNGSLPTTGIADVVGWNSEGMVTFIDMVCNSTGHSGCNNLFLIDKYGFRFCRSAE
jgi:hypothetical protein